MPKIIDWLTSSKYFSLPRRYLFKLIKNTVSLKKYILIYYGYPEKARVIELVKNIGKERKMIVNEIEGYQIFDLVKKASKIEGDTAEVGVFEGATAKIICEAKNHKPLHLFDTFEGLPQITENDDPAQFYKGQYKADMENVKEYLKNYPEVYFYKGLFNSTSDLVKYKKFAFVNLDVDLYESTMDCLDFFYPRMSRGGIIISHDYIGSQGVKKAFDEFFKNKPEPVLELLGVQCLIIKT
ncbi:MAG TPA: TylF/MycF/NovP-related O-methyltransferase [Candidatus Omnitrophota bacterium]|nr:TylF/MycF/NovP-related O-methyltransferase [Candidatus Omnitrophota bacterium]